MVDFLTGEQRDSLIELYIAYFNRAPESGGLSFHANAVIEDLNAGLDFQAALNNRADNFFSAAIDLGVYSNAMTADEFVAEVYENTLLRPGVGGDAPTEAELSYWTARLESGEIGRGDLVTEFLDSIDFLIENGTDDEVAVATQVNAVLENRVEVARVFSMPENSGGLTGQAAIDAGTAAIAGVDATEESVQEAIDDIEDGSVGVVGDTFTLTAGIDDIDGTAGNDLFRVVTAGDLASTDIVNGSGGEDVLNIAAGGNAVGAAPVITGVERINSASTNALDLSAVTGLEQLWSSDDGDYDSADVNTVFGIENTAAATNVTVDLSTDADLSGDSDAVNVALNNNDATVGNDLTFDFGANNAEIEVLNVTSVAAGGILNVANQTELTDINVTGEGAVQIDIDAANDVLETVDASMNSGDTTVNVAAGATVDTIMTGEGEDDVTLNGQIEVVVDLGADDDTATLAGTESGSDLTGGDGFDSFEFTSVANIAVGGTASTAATEADLEDIISIADFNADEDVIDVSAGGYSFATLTNTESQAVSTAASLLDAVDTAAGYLNGSLGTPAESAVVFEYEGSTYIYTDVDDDQAFTQTDGLVEITGFTGDLDGTNFVS